MNVLFSPHADDETLFAAFTIIRERPKVVICYPSSGDYGSTEERFDESCSACAVLGADSVEQWKGGPLIDRMRKIDTNWQPATVWAPHPKASHGDHIAVAWAARTVFGDRVVHYHTYIEGRKIAEGQRVPFEPAWVQLKLIALASYRSQIHHARANQFFCFDLHEYQGPL